MLYITLKCLKTLACKSELQRKTLASMQVINTLVNLEKNMQRRDIIFSESPISKFLLLSYYFLLISG